MPITGFDTLPFIGFFLQITASSLTFQIVTDNIALQSFQSLSFSSLHFSFFRGFLIIVSFSSSTISPRPHISSLTGATFPLFFLLSFSFHSFSPSPRLRQSRFHFFHTPDYAIFIAPALIAIDDLISIQLVFRYLPFSPPRSPLARYAID
jgi:hypothetical protein